VKARRLAPVVLLLAVLKISGCVSVSPPPQTYLLSVAPSASPAPIAPVVVGVGPIGLPAYLDRSAIVVRTGERGEVSLSGDHRWAELLREGIPRTLAGNLSAMIPTDAVPIFPWRAPWTVRYRVTVDILRFDGALGESVVLDARWRLLDGAGKELALRTVHLEETCADGTYGGLVSAHNRLLASLSHDIAVEIQRRIR
jgi:uncharacterized lipoprotein YmbA